MADTHPSEKDHRGRGSSDSVSKAEVDHHSLAPSADKPSPSGPADEDLRQRHDVSAKMENPLAGFSREQITNLSEEFCAQHGFTDDEDIRAFRLGAAIAGNNFEWDTIGGLRDDEKEALRMEIDHKWKSNPKTLYGVIVVCVSRPTHSFPNTLDISHCITYNPNPNPNPRPFAPPYKGWTKRS